MTFSWRGRREGPRLVTGKPRPARSSTRCSTGARWAGARSASTGSRGPPPSGPSSLRLFSELFQRTYLSRIQLADREKFAVSGRGHVRASGRRRQDEGLSRRRGSRFPLTTRRWQRPGRRSGRSTTSTSRAISLVRQLPQPVHHDHRGAPPIRTSSRSCRRSWRRAPARSAQATASSWSGPATSHRASATATRPRPALLDAIGGMVFTLGDHAYEAGTPIEFAACYEESWGRHRARTRPTPGNHDYLTAGAPRDTSSISGPPPGLLTRATTPSNHGAWRVIVLNSNCAEIGGCGAGSPQERWLRHELASEPARLHARLLAPPTLQLRGARERPHLRRGVLAGSVRPAVRMSCWEGHDHIYERFIPQSPDGAADARRGLRQFIVGTGGATHHPFVGPALANSEIRNDDTFGVPASPS